MNPKVISLVPAATDMLLAIGGAHLLSGCTLECQLPPTLSVPRLSHEDLPLLRALTPDLLFVPPSRQSFLQSLFPSSRLVSIDPRSVESMLDATLQVGEASNLLAPARHAVVAMRNRMFDAAECVNPYVEGPAVGFLLSLDPPRVAGEWIVQLLERAGGRHPWNPTSPREGLGSAAGPQHGERSAPRGFTLSADDWLALNPQFIILSDPAHPVDSPVPEWLANAARQTPLLRLHPSRFLPSPRLVDAFVWLVACINRRPQLAPQGFPPLPAMP